MPEQNGPVLNVPAKPFLKIGEVAKLLGIKPHVLRYWESEFPSLRPRKNPSGQRIYTRADVEAIVEIQNLLYNSRYTISGAKQMLTQRDVSEAPLVSKATQAVAVQELALLKECIHDLLRTLQDDPTL